MTTGELLMECDSNSGHGQVARCKSETTQFHSYFSFIDSVRLTFPVIFTHNKCSTDGNRHIRKVAPAGSEKLEKLGNCLVLKEKLPSLVVLSVSLTRSDQKSIGNTEASVYPDQVDKD